MIKSQILIILAFISPLASACPNVPFCRECTTPKDKEARICRTCNYAYFDQGSLSCKTDIQKIEDNCNQYHKENDKVTCVSCDFGSRLVAEGKCVKCPTEHCAICDGEGKCKACFWGAKLKDGVCDAKNECELKKCEICHDRTAEKKDWTCELCKPGYALNKYGECVLSGENCQIADADDNVLCSKCKSGFYLDEHFLCRANAEKPAGGHGWAWFIFILVLAAVGVLFYYRSQRRSQPGYQKVSAEDYVTVN